MEVNAQAMEVQKMNIYWYSANIPNNLNFIKMVVCFILVLVGFFLSLKLLFKIFIENNDSKMIDEFFETMSQTADRENIVNHTYDYYKHYYESLHKENMSDLYVVTVDVEKLKKT